MCMISCSAHNIDFDPLHSECPVCVLEKKVIQNEKSMITLAIAVLKAATATRNMCDSGTLGNWSHIVKLADEAEEVIKILKETPDTSWRGLI